MQDTFYIAYTKAGNLRSDTILPYLRRIAIHECYRKRYAAQDVLLSSTYLIDNREESDVDFLPEAYLNETEQRAELLRIIMTLPKMQWETVYLYYYASFTTDEIARLHKCSTSNVRKTLRNARAAIKAHMEGKRKKSTGILLASAGAVSLAAVFMAEEQAFAAVFVPAAAPYWAGAGASTAAIAATTATTTAATATSGYVITACVAAFVAVSTLTYITLWPDPEPDPIPEPYIVYEATAPPTSPITTTPAPTPQRTTPPTTPPETEPPTTPPITTYAPPPPQTTLPPPTVPPPQPAPNRTSQILAALATATTQADITRIIDTYGFQFARVIRIDGAELRFYAANEGSGDIMIGTSTGLDTPHFRFDFMFYENSYMPSESMDLIFFMERD